MLSSAATQHGWTASSDSTVQAQSSCREAHLFSVVALADLPVTGCEVLQAASASCVTKTDLVASSCHCLHVAMLVTVLQSGQNLDRLCDYLTLVLAGPQCRPRGTPAGALFKYSPETLHTSAYYAAHMKQRVHSTVCL